MKSEEIKALNDKTLGFIIPPPEIKKFIDKAAEIVAKIGEEAEKKMKEEGGNLPKFSFLKDNDTLQTILRT